MKLGTTKFNYLQKWWQPQTTMNLQIFILVVCLNIPLGIPATVMQMEAQMVVSSDKRRPETATGN